MVRLRRWVLGFGVVLVLVAVPAGYSAYRMKHLRNFGVVEDGVLYRSGQLNPAGLQRVLSDYRIKTVVTLRHSRDPRLPHDDAWEEDVCAPRGVRHVRILPRVWSKDENGKYPIEDGLKEFLDVMDDPANHPVLVHCMAGIHRTGQMTAFFRMERHRWTADEAMAEMEAYGYDLLDMHNDVSKYLTAYQPRWKRTVAAGPME